jgi:peptide chain release factor 2
MELQKKIEKIAEIEGQKKEIEWGSQILTMCCILYKLVKDLRTIKKPLMPRMLGRNLEDFVKAYLMEYGLLHN